LESSVAHSAGQSPFDPGYFERLVAIEDRHFWFRSRNHTISVLVNQITQNLAPGYRVLEVGCGTGNVLRFLERTCTRGLVVGVEFFWEGLQRARQRVNCSLVQGDIGALPFRTRFELIGLFDVLEHLQDDEQILRNLHCLLVPNGALLLTVPAHQSLWSYFDAAACHARRYALNELENKILCAGFAIEYLTPYMASIFPLVWLKRRFLSSPGRGIEPGDANRIRNCAAEEFRIIPVLNGLLAFLLAQECRLLARRRRIPFGASLLAIARRP